jgi:hypothetical protein
MCVVKKIGRVGGRVAYERGKVAWLVNACVNDYEMHLGKHSLEDLRMFVSR